jgi:large subunit ribosomal protein L29
MPTQLDLLDDERLIAELGRAKEELFNLRFASATGQLESHGRLKAVRRDIARIYTVLRERELGIRTAPTANVDASEDAKPKGRKARKAKQAEPAPADQDTAAEASQAEEAENE